MIRALCQILHIKHHVSTPYYPQSNGKIERVVGIVEIMLERAVQEDAMGRADEGSGSNVLGIGVELNEGVMSEIKQGC